MATIEELRAKRLVGRNARLLNEWDLIEQHFGHDREINCVVRKRNPDDLPIVYDVFYNIRSFCGVEEPDANGLQKPLYADRFLMRITIPNNYPSADAKLEFKFQLTDAFGNEIPHPWHPNIRFYGDFAGRVCLNTDACGTYTDLSWYIGRVAQYLRYETYHALIGVPPYPEDDLVAAWVVEQGEPNHWVEELQDYHQHASDEQPQGSSDEEDIIEIAL